MGMKKSRIRIFSVGFTSTSLSDNRWNCYVRHRDPNSNSKLSLVCVSYWMVIHLSIKKECVR